MLEYLIEHYISRLQYAIPAQLLQFIPYLAFHYFALLCFIADLTDLMFTMVMWHEYLKTLLANI